MMRSLGIILVTGSLIYFAFTRFTPIHQYEGISLQEMETDFATLEAKLTRYAQSRSLPEGGSEELIAMKDRKLWLGRAITCEKYQLNGKVLGLLIFGSLILILQILIPALRKLKQTGSTPFFSNLNVENFIAREEYVDDWELKRKMEDGFTTREEALQWMSQDPLLTCDYCGSKLKSTFTGDREALEFVTYYKKVPPGAKDMRIVIGSRWYGKAATELKCSGCDRLIHR
jgi:hypothetical protein